MNSGGGREIRHRPEASHRNFFCDFELHTTGASASSEAPRSAQILEEFGLNRGSREDKEMRYLKYFVLLAICMLPAAAPSQAQVRVAVRVGGGYGYVAPVCAYGYYGYAPYACAPYGYYGPDYFDGGVFIGAGPWFRGFYGRSYYGGWGGYYGRGWRGDHDGFRDRDRGRDRGDGGWRGRDGFRDH